MYKDKSISPSCRARSARAIASSADSTGNSVAKTTSGSPLYRLAEGSTSSADDGAVPAPPMEAQPDKSMTENVMQTRMIRRCMLQPLENIDYSQDGRADGHDEECRKHTANEWKN